MEITGKNVLKGAFALAAFGAGFLVGGALGAMVGAVGFGALSIAPAFIAQNLAVTLGWAAVGGKIGALIGGGGLGAYWAYKASSDSSSDEVAEQDKKGDKLAPSPALNG
jgi:hypothetical protein